MKKIISLFVSISLLLGFTIPNGVLAAGDENLEKLIRKSKQVFEIGEEYSKFEYSKFKNDDITIYDFNWSDEEETERINVNIDSSGFITNYGKYSNQEDYESKIPEVTEAEGKKIAENFLAKINPEIKDNIKYKGNEIERELSINHYYFEFVRTENSIPYIQNSVNVNVNNMTGEIKSYHVNWEKNLEFPKDEGIISKEEADKIYKEKVSFELMYKYDYKGKEKKPQLVYSVIDRDKSIDAKTGEIFNYSNNYLRNEKMSKDAMSLGNDNNELSEEEINAIKLSQDIIGEMQAESIAREFAKIDKNFKLSHANMGKQQDSYIWYLNFNKEKDNKFEGTSLYIDAKTKEVIQFNKYRDRSEKEKQVFNKEQSLEIAKKYLESIQLEKSNQVKYMDIRNLEYEIYEEEYPAVHTFKFTRIVNDMMFEGDGFDIKVDSSTGEITNYSTSWYKGELPNSDNVISKENAYEIFKNRANLELQYIDKISDFKKNEKNLILAYVLETKDKIDVDAKTGKLVDLYNYRVDKSEKIDYTDIDKSIAKDQITTLMNLGIYLPGTEFKPKEKISQSDFLYLLLKSRGNYIEYDDIEELYKIMIGQKIVKKDEKSPKSYVSREEAIKYVIRVLNFEKVADIKGIYKIEFKDEGSIDERLKGHIAISKGLGIVSGTNDGNFRPKESLTREQAIIIIYNMMKSKS